MRFLDEVFTQLLPGIQQGLMTVILTPPKLKKSYNDMNYRILPLLGVNRNIGKEWRALPKRYQGLGLPNFELYTFSKKIHFLQQQ